MILFVVSSFCLLYHKKWSALTIIITIIRITKNGVFNYNYDYNSYNIAQHPVPIRKYVQFAVNI